MDVTAKIDLMTIDEYIRLSAQAGPFEIINGERQPKMPPVALHNITIRALFLLLYAFCKERTLGEVFSEMAFVLSYEANWVKGSRVPDLMFITQARWQQYVQTMPDWKRKPIILVPDLVVEVVSSTDLYGDVQAKILRYLQDGVQQVWVLDPEQQIANIHSGQQATRLTSSDVLSGAELLPGLQIPLAELFAE